MARKLGSYPIVVTPRTAAAAPDSANARHTRQHAWSVAMELKAQHPHWSMAHCTAEAWKRARGDCVAAADEVA